MSLVLLFHYLLLNMFRMLVVRWFDVCWYYGVVRLGWCVILMQAEALVLLRIAVLTFETG